MRLEHGPRRLVIGVIRRTCAAVSLVGVIAAGGPAHSAIWFNFAHPRVNLVSEGFSYTSAFSTALWWKFARELTGKDYVTFVGPTRYRLELRSGLCTAGDMAEWKYDPSRCTIASGATDLTCWNRNGCVVFGVSPSLVQDERFRSWIISAIENPCAMLRDPHTYETAVEGRVQGGAPLTPNAVWAVLACGGHHPTTGYDIHINQQTGVIEFKFNN